MGGGRFWGMVLAVVTAGIGIVGGRALGFNNMGAFWRKDVTPPPALAAFTGATSATDGYVNVTITFPADQSDYDQVVIRRLGGATAPNAACNNGTVVATFTRPTFPNQAPLADFASVGQYYSYRACLYDISGNVTSSQTIVNVRAGWPCAGTRYAEN
jgi:hypothetical protein